jgi:DNA-binding HxlR family transcriptional regulator
MPRTPEDPTPEDVLAEMEPGVPYTVGDLTEQFEEVSRWTLQRRLEALHEAGEIRRKKHAENRVSWWRER